MFRIAVVIGTRPQIVKVAPLFNQIRESHTMYCETIHTGQHYDSEMSQVFFSELGMPRPEKDLGVGSGTHAWQIGEVMKRTETVLAQERPDLVVVPGDTNSALGAALAATKLNLPLAHLESGARTYETAMPEEVNRRLIDHCSSLLYAVSRNCENNLRREAPPGRVFEVGDTMCDSFLSHRPAAEKIEMGRRMGLENHSYAILTLHRAENVDDPKRLRRIVKLLRDIGKYKVIFPVHPRTLGCLSQSGLIREIERRSNILLAKPLSYREMISLLLEARFLITDSGGLQKEAFWALTPCVTLREKTEWVETVQIGANYLVDRQLGNLKSNIRFVARNHEVLRRRIQRAPNPYRSGASQRIVRSIHRDLERISHRIT